MTESPLPPRRRALLGRLRAFLVGRLGLSRAIAWTLADTAVRILKSPLSVYFLIRYLTPVEQGLWYSFINLEALKLLAELGFTYIITQFVSHEFAHVELRQGVIVGDPENKDRLFSLVRYAIRFYLAVLPVAVLILASVGTAVYRPYSTNVLVCWYLFTLSSAISLLGTLFQSIYQGLNQVSLIRRNTFVGTLITSAATWGFLMGRTGLWALPATTLIANGIMLALLYRQTSRFWWQVVRYKIRSAHPWIRKLMSLQWRYAITWISGYFIFYFMVPMALRFQGAVEAGQLGLSLAIFSALSGMVGAWGNTKVPEFNMLVSQRRRTEIDALLSRVQRQSLAISLAGTAAVFAIILLLFPVLRWQQRILSPIHLVFIALAGIPLLIVANWAYYLRAHKEEPYMVLTVVNGILLGCVIWASLSQFHSILLAVASYCCTQWIMLIPAGLILRRRKQIYTAAAFVPVQAGLATTSNDGAR